jgi:hypothetical protein
MALPTGAVDIMQDKRFLQQRSDVPRLLESFAMATGKELPKFRKIKDKGEAAEWIVLP